MTNKMTVCILTAGQGSRMGALSGIINKCLLPYKGKAIISHIIASFPEESSFVIALGYKGEQVQAYLTIAHPHHHFQFVQVDPYTGPHTGPGYSLLCCRDLLNQPFYFVSCDTLFEAPLDKAPATNWVGVSKVARHTQTEYCNMVVSNKQVTDILDKQISHTRSYAFTGLMYIHDVSVFWTSLADPQCIAGEHQISNGLLGLMAHATLQPYVITWVDVGTYDKYRQAVEATEKYDFSKTNEFLYFVNQQVIKFFSDESIVSGRAKKTLLKPQVFPALTHVNSQWYSYPFFRGHTLYQQNTPQLFEKLLGWLEEVLWTPAAGVSSSDMQVLCKKFYHDKTLARLADYDKKYPSEPVYHTVNGISVDSIATLMEKMPWEALYQGIPTFIHGDLQFDNILYDDVSHQFMLLDWRQDFAGEVAFGDMYYDLAKLMGGMMLNYDYIKTGLFQVTTVGQDIQVDFAHRFKDRYYVDSLSAFMKRRGLDVKRVEWLLGLIYLNMSPLHHPPFDQALHALGRLILTQALDTSSASGMRTQSAVMTTPC